MTAKQPDSKQDCPMCGMPKDFRPWNEFAEPQCWNWRAAVRGECPYQTEEAAADMRRNERDAGR